MRLGISSWAHPWAIGVPGHLPEHPMTVFELLDRAADLGVPVVQLADNLPAHELSDEEITQLRRHADRLGLDLELGTVSLDPEHLERYRQLAKRLRAPFLRVVIDTPARKPTDAEIIRELAELLPEFESDGLRLLIENHDRFPAKTLRSILEGVNRPSVGVCLDTVNSLGSLETAETVFDTLAPWVMNVHIKDFTIHRAPHLMGFSVEGRPAGEGRLDLPELIRGVRHLPTDPNVILELWPPPEDELRTTIEKEHAWVASSVRYLRGIV